MTLLLLCLFIALAVTKDDEGDWGKGDIHVKFNPKRGFQPLLPFDLTLTNPAGYDAIRYVILSSDSSQPPPLPSQTSGTVYTGPITITTHCIVQAIGYGPAGVTNVTTHSFFNYAAVASQPALLSYVMNDPRYSSKFTEALQTLSVVSFRSLVRYQDTYSVSHGKAPIIPVNCEYFPPFGSSQKPWSAPVGEENTGAYSLQYPKKSTRIRFDRTESWNQNKIEYDFFSEYNFTLSAKGIKYGLMSMRSCSQDSVFAASFAGAYGTYPSYMKNAWFSLLQSELGYYSAKFRYVHIFWNSQYVGVNQFVEKPGSGNLAEYFGTQRENFETIAAGKPSNEIGDSGWQRIVNQGSPIFASNRKRLDETSFADYYILGLYSADSYDVSLTYNWQTSGPTSAVLDSTYLGEKFLGPYDFGFKSWHNDEDFSFLLKQKDQVGFTTNLQGVVGNMYSEGSLDFRMLFTDRLHLLFVNPGYLSDTKSIARWEWIRKTWNLDVALIPESARWGNQFNSWTVDRFASDLSALYSQFITGRATKCVNWLKTQGAYFTINQPSFSLPDNVAVAPGTPLTITTDAGCKSYYTLTGVDPRLPGGGIHTDTVQGASNAETITLSTTTTVWARCYKSATSWGPIYKLYIPVNTPTCELCDNIIVTEIHYEPYKMETFRTSSDLSCFVELKNIGSTPINMNGATFTTFEFTFPPVVIQPGAFYVITRSWQDFVDTYQRKPDHRYFGKMENDDKLKLKDSVGRTVFSITYANNVPWSELADGYNYSIVPRNYSKNLDNPKNWRTSTVLGGSPGADDFTMPPSREIPLIINEIFPSQTAGQSWVEVINPSTQAVSLWGWHFSSKYEDASKGSTSMRYDAAADSSKSIAASSTAAIDLTFIINNTYDDDINIFAAEKSSLAPIPLITMEHIHEDSKATLPGLSLGRIQLSTGEYVFALLAAPTKGAANAAPYLSSVIIAAVGYQQPTSGLYVALQYVQLKNIGSTATSIAGWTVGIGSKSQQEPFVFPAGTSLAPGQSLFLLNKTTTDAQFQFEYEIGKAGDLYFIPFNASTLVDKVTLRQATSDAGVAYTVNVDGVPVDEFKPKLEPGVIDPNVPLKLERIISPAVGYAGDVASWKVTPIALRPKFPTNQPTTAPTEAPTAPTNAPTPPTNAPTSAPTEAPTAAPTRAPTEAPTAAPSVAPTESPTGAPTQAPTEAPTVAPTPPTRAPTNAPTSAPTEAPTAAPTRAPTEAPTAAPTPPTDAPTDAPTEAPTAPTEAPTESPTGAPTPPTEAPTPVPTEAPTPPTEAPTSAPVVPTLDPGNPTFNPADLIANVTWRFKAKGNHTFDDVYKYITPALRRTTLFFLTHGDKLTFFNSRSKRDISQDEGETWMASITGTDVSTTNQLEADALAAWLNSQVAVAGASQTGGGNGSGGSGLSLIALVALILCGIIIFLIILWVIVILVLSPSSNKNKAMDGHYENL